MYELLLIPLFFTIILFLRIRKIKSFDHIGFIYSIWLFASFCGFLYTQTDILYQGKGIVKIEAVTYMLLMFYITMQPMEKSCQLTKKNYIINSSQLITWTMYIIAACSYLPFVENVLHLGSGNTLSTLSDNYGAQEIRNFDARAHMSWLGARLNSVTMLCKYITPILLMNYLSTCKKKKRWILTGLMMGIFNPAICMFNVGSRWVAIEDIVFFMFLFFLYKNLFPTKIRHYIQVTFIAIASIVTLGIASITIGRFANTEFTITEWLYRYIGEGFANFTTDMWYTNHSANGMHIFRNFYDDTVSRLNDLMGIRMYVFYTYVGDFFADCGFVGCVIVCALLFILGKKIFSYKNYSIYNIFAGSMYCKIFLTGFTYIVYINTLTEFITASIFFTLCKVCQKTYLIKATNHKV